MTQIMIVDDMAVIREPIAAALRSAGYDTVTAAGGLEALELIKTRVPELIILDLSMPKVGGMAVLRALRNSPSTSQIPVILLTVSSDKHDILMAGKLGVRDYVLKTRFSLNELLDRVKKRLTPINLQSTADDAAPNITSSATRPQEKKIDDKPLRLLTREEAITRAEMALGMKTLPGVVMEVISQADSPRTDSASLATLIGRDSVLAARVLQAANSSAYASTRGPVTTLSEAVRNIGCSAVRNVAASVGIFEAMPDNREENLNLLRCWQHSLAVAALCERLASISEVCPPNVAYLVGLCHDLGEIVFRTTFATEFRQILDHQATTGADRQSIEREVLGITHHELAAAILDKIGLPDSIRRPIDAMKSPAQIQNDPVAKLLIIADYYANGLTLCDSAQCNIAPVTKMECQAVVGQEDPVVPDRATFRAEIVSLTSVLGRLSAAEERELAKPLVHTTKARVWLMRDPAFSAFDPVAALLAGISRLTVSDKPPTGSEAADIDRVIILTPTTADLPKSEELRHLAAPGRILCIAGQNEGTTTRPSAIELLAYPTQMKTFSNFVSSPAANAAA